MILRLICLTLLLAPILHSQRLPTGVHPEHYTLALTPNLQAATFTGQETIDLTLDTPTPTITLNSAEIKILTVTEGSQQATISYDPAKEQATFTFPQALAQGPHRLTLDYTGILNDKLRGFYLSKTKLRNYAVTQFEATDARRAFPSFDEPALKATFAISLTVDTPDTVLSNSSLLSDTPATPGKHTLTFSTTPKMSTYLVAFLVGDFQCTLGKADGVPIRVCGTPDKLKYTRFALQAAEYILPFYDKYFGIKYPMPKLDLIGLPDFEAGAMENFGCITYRETDLLIDDHASLDAKKNVASVVAHEMAHQWFGDMVTMQWWDNLWLNEGFATWMSSKPITAWHPEWNFPQDVAASLDATLNLDAQPTTHPIRAKETETPDQINELFDGISYGKGGAVLGMVENYLGPEVFRQGVHNYLAAHLYANATGEDFWIAQTANSGKPVDKIMASFIDQPGVPLLAFGEPAQPATALPVAQSRFFLAPSVADQRTAATLAPGWTIPLCLRLPPSSQTCELLAPDQIALSPAPIPRLFVANAGDHGYYRTAYTTPQLSVITSAAETLTPTERIGLLGDQYALVRAGQQPIASVLDLILALKRDPDASVLQSALRKLEAIQAQIATPEDAARIDALIRREISPIYASLGKARNNDPYNTQELRSFLFQYLGSSGDPAILTEATKLTATAFNGKPAKNPVCTDAAVSVASRTGDAALYDKLQFVAENATDPALKTDALHALAHFESPVLVIRTLDYAASGKVRNQDSWSLFSLLLTNPKTRELAWQYIQQHWEAVHAQLTANSGTKIVAATGSFCTVQGRDEVQSFFTSHHVDASERTLAKSLDSINDCIRRRTAQQPALHTWLSTH